MDLLEKYAIYWSSFTMKKTHHLIQLISILSDQAVDCWDWKQNRGRVLLSIISVDRMPLPLRIEDVSEKVSSTPPGAFRDLNPSAAQTAENSSLDRVENCILLLKLI